MLDGTLEVDLINGFTPSIGDSFDILNGTTTGTFGSFKLTPLPAGLNWDTSALYSQGVIMVAPEPSSLALLGAGAIGLIGYALRRR